MMVRLALAFLSIVATQATATASASDCQLDVENAEDATCFMQTSAVVKQKGPKDDKIAKLKGIKKKLKGENQVLLSKLETYEALGGPDDKKMTPEEKAAALAAKDRAAAEARQTTVPPPSAEYAAFDPSADGMTDWDKQYISDTYGGPFFDGQDKIPKFKGQNLPMGVQWADPRSSESTTAEESVETTSTTVEPVLVVKPEKNSSQAETKTEATAEAGPVKIKIQQARTILSPLEQVQEIAGSRFAVATALFGFGSIALIYIFLLEPGENRYYFQLHQTHTLPAWGIMSTTICVFCSYLIISSVRNIAYALLDGAAEAYPFALDATLLCGYFALFHTLMWHFRENWWVNEGVGQIGAFTMGFAGTDAMGTYFASQQAFSGTLLSSMSTVICLLLLLSVVLIALTISRANVHESFTQNMVNVAQGRSWDAWHERSKRSDTLVCSMAIGYLGMQCVSFAQSGEYYPMHARPTTASPLEAGELMATAFVFGTVFFVQVLTIGHHQDQWRSTHRHQVQDLARSTCAFACSWCALSACGWFFWSDNMWSWSGGSTPGKAMTASMLAAVAISLICLPIAIAVSHGKEVRAAFFGIVETWGVEEDQEDGEGEFYGTKDIVHGLGLATGLSWGSAFTLAARAWGVGLARANPYVGQSDAGPLFQAFICLTLCAWILPAWALYIMPLSLGHQHGFLEKGMEVLGADVMSLEQKAEVHLSAGVQVLEDGVEKMIQNASTPR